MSVSAKKDEKMNFRIDKESKKIIERGAKLSGVGASSAFIIQAAVREAQEVILRSREVEKVLLSNRDFDSMMEKIASSKKPNVKAKLAMSKFKKERP